MNKIWTGWATPDWRAMSWPDRLAWFIGTGFGCGFFPFAPGSVGSAGAVAVYAVIMLVVPASGPFSPFIPVGQLVALLALAGGGFIVGVWATGRMSTDANPDPGAAVWDEFVGMWLALLPLAGRDWEGQFGWNIGWLAAAFIVFRAFDTLKPWPCRRLEQLHGGWGIMLDDVAAGVWSMLALQAGAVLLALAGWLWWVIETIL